MIVHPVEIVLLGNLKMYLDVTIVEFTDSKTRYTAISKKVITKNLHAAILKGIMGYDQYTFPGTQSMSTLLFLLSFSSRSYMSMASRAFLSNFFEKR